MIKAAKPAQALKSACATKSSFELTISAACKAALILQTFFRG
jgi:hypothetical protein